MARFVHIADARDAARIRRNGLRAKPVLCCVPMAADPSAAFQWARELRRRGYRTSVAIVFTLPDDLRVKVGHFRHRGVEIAGGQVAAWFQEHADVRGLEVRVPEGVAPGAINAVRQVPRNVGWRFYPEAKGRQPLWPTSGEIKAHRLRRTLDAKYPLPWRKPDSHSD